MAKKQRLIGRRALKWTGAVLCILIVAMFLSSRSTSVKARTTSTAGTTWYVQLAGGCVHMGVTRYPALGLLKRQTEITQHKLMRPGWRLWLDWHREKVTSGNSVNYVFVPLWMPLLLISVPTVWFWRDDRRRKPTERKA